MTPRKMRLVGWVLVAVLGSLFVSQRWYPDMMPTPLAIVLSVLTVGLALAITTWRLTELTAAQLVTLLGAVAAGFAIVFVALGAAVGSLYWNRVEAHGETVARQELKDIAAEEVPKVFGYDYQTVERSLTETYPYFTSAYRPQFQDHVTNEIIPQARERRLVNRVDVTGIGVMVARRSSGSVLVYMNRTFTDKSQKEFYDASRLQIDFRKVNDKWLIDNMKPI